jgi:hypothetical protein
MFNGVEHSPIHQVSKDDNASHGNFLTNSEGGTRYGIGDDAAYIRQDCDNSHYPPRNPGPLGLVRESKEECQEAAFHCP